jgi:HK97 family phage portal protein
MSMWRRQRREAPTFQGVPWDAASLIPSRSGVGRHGAVNVTQDRALAHSGVWAATRIRADLLISTMPVDVYRDVDFGNGPVATTSGSLPPILASPGGREWRRSHWMWASQHSLDMVGNAIGIIRERNGVKTPEYPDGLPSRIDLQDYRDCAVQMYKGKKTYKIAGTIYQPREIYHEMQYRLGGLPVGLSPVIYAAACIGEYLSLQQFGLDWFAGGGVPKAWMRNTAKRLQGGDRDQAKQWYSDTIRNGDLMVTGNDWEYNMIQAEQAGTEWLEGRRYGLVDIARFFAVPAEMLDAAVQGQSITYANITQRNLQFLIMNLGPAVYRREEELTLLLPAPRYVKLNTKALLRMDPETQQKVLRSQLETWQLTLAEVRDLDDRRMLDKAQIDEMEKIYGRPLIAGKAAATPPQQPQQQPEEQQSQQDGQSNFGLAALAPWTVSANGDKATVKVA